MRRVAHQDERTPWALRVLQPRGGRVPRWYSQRRLACLMLLMLSASAVSAQSPVYTVTKPDAVTGDNPTQNFTVPGVNCTNCRLPDPNGAVDQYTQDIWERPTQSGSSANVYFPALDIRNGFIGFDATYLYYRIELFGVDPSTGGLPYFYGFEINFDADSRGDMYVRVEDPRSKVGTTFGTSGVIAFHDANNNIGGANPTAPNGPGGTVDGYEFKAFDQGTNNSPGGAGGNTAVVARIVPGSPYMVEIAVRRVFLNALNGGAQVQQAAFRPYASKGGATNTESNFLMHDKFSRLESGSPYPWLAQAGAPASCPGTLAAENALSAAQRAALDSGTNVNTGINNPCYPSGGNLIEFDNGGTLSDFANGNDINFNPPANVNLVKSVNPAGNQIPGAELTYTVVYTNSGGQAASNFIIIDPNPLNVDPLERVFRNIDFKIGSMTSTPGTSGLVASFSYSNDGGVTWTYTPVSGAGGAPADYDRNVTNIRWTFAGNLSQTSPNNTGSVGFTARIR